MAIWYLFLHYIKIYLSHLTGSSASISANGRLGELNFAFFNQITRLLLTRHSMKTITFSFTVGQKFFEETVFYPRPTDKQLSFSNEL